MGRGGNKQGEYEAKVLRGGQTNLALEDFVDLNAAKDPGHFEPNGKLEAMDRDGVEAEVIFPEVGGAKIARRAGSATTGGPCSPATTTAWRTSRR